MKRLILLVFTLSSFLLFACSNGKKVYWCGDHACTNKKEKEAYFKKTMIVEIRELGNQNKKSKSELEIIKRQNNLEQKKIVKREKSSAKQARLEKKNKVREQNELAKLERLKEKRRIKEEKELARQVRLEEKKIIKVEKKLNKKKIQKAKNIPIEKEIVINAGIVKIDTTSTEFNELIKKITKRNMFRSYPNINDIPN